MFFSCDLGALKLRKITQYKQHKMLFIECRVIECFVLDNFLCPTQKFPVLVGIYNADLSFAKIIKVRKFKILTNNKVGFTKPDQHWSVKK